MTRTGTGGSTQTWWRGASLAEGDRQEHGLPDLVDRDFTADATDEKMVVDMTHILPLKGRLFLLIAVIDCHTKPDQTLQNFPKRH